MDFFCFFFIIFVLNPKCWAPIIYWNSGLPSAFCSHLNCFTLAFHLVQVWLVLLDSFSSVHASGKNCVNDFNIWNLSKHIEVFFAHCLHKIQLLFFSLFVFCNVYLWTLESGEMCTLFIFQQLCFFCIISMCSQTTRSFYSLYQGSQ